MEVSMNQLALSTLLSVVLGAALGVVYDVFRFIRVLFSVKVRSPFGKKGIRPYFEWIFTAVGDLVFMMIVAVCLCVFFFLTGDGRVRIYPLAGAFLGFEIYYHTLGRLFIGIVDFLAEKVKQFFAFVFCFLKKLLIKAAKGFLNIPFVRSIVAWYKERETVLKKAKAEKIRRRKMKKGGSIRNGF